MAPRCILSVDSHLSDSNFNLEHKVACFLTCILHFFPLFPPIPFLTSFLPIFLLQLQDKETDYDEMEQWLATHDPNAAVCISLVLVRSPLELFIHLSLSLLESLLFSFYEPFFFFQNKFSVLKNCCDRCTQS